MRTSKVVIFLSMPTPTSKLEHSYSLYYYLFNSTSNSSTSIPCTMQASSNVSACDAGHPKQCIPADNKISAFSGAASSNSPIFVVFYIFISFLLLSKYFLHFITFFKKSIDIY